MIYVVSKFTDFPREVFELLGFFPIWFGILFQACNQPIGLLFPTHLNLYVITMFQIFVMLFIPLLIYV